jgi:uncharacterized membrane protein
MKRGKIMKQPRWNSVVLWTSIVAQVFSLLQLLRVFAKLGIDLGYAGNIAAAVLQILVVVGILNNPQDPTGDIIKLWKTNIPSEHKFFLKPDTADDRDYLFKNIVSTTQLPKDVDLRAKNATNI